jgi:hypothetical protein
LYFAGGHPERGEGWLNPFDWTNLAVSPSE